MPDDLDNLFRFLGRIQDDPALRELLNTVETVPDVAMIAADQGLPFAAATLLAALEQCQESVATRYGLMDEKLIRVYLQRDRLRSSLGNA